MNSRFALDARPTPWLVIPLLCGIFAFLVAASVYAGRAPANPSACLHFVGYEGHPDQVYEVAKGLLLPDRRARSRIHPPPPAAPQIESLGEGYGPISQQHLLWMPEGRALIFLADAERTSPYLHVDWLDTEKHRNRTVITGLDGTYDEAYREAEGVGAFYWWRTQSDGKLIGGVTGITPDGQTAFQFTFPTSAIYRYAVLLAVHPDRTRAIVRIVYSDYPIFGAAYILHAGRGPQRLTALRVPFGGAAWSADGESFAMAGFTDAPNAIAVALYRANGELIRLLPPVFWAYPDGLTWTDCQ